MDLLETKQIIYHPKGIDESYLKMYFLLNLSHYVKSYGHLCQISTNHPMPPDDNNWIKPAVHPCKKRYMDIPPTEFEADYIDLLNTCQRHTRCSSDYCPKKSSNEGELKCRFKFPFQESDQTTLEFEPVHKKTKVCLTGLK